MNDIDRLEKRIEALEDKKGKYQTARIVGSFSSDGEYCWDGKEWRTAYARVYGRRICDCGVQNCTYPEFRENHSRAVHLVRISTGYSEPLLPVSHILHMRENVAKLEKRKEEARNRANTEFTKALNSIKARHQEALKKAEEMK